MVDHQNKDTLIINIGEHFQPVFKSKNGDTAELPYNVESVLFENTKGNRLNGWIIKPEEGYNGTTILFLHSNSGNLFTQYQEVLPLVKNGFSVFIFDYSGYGFSQGKATRDNVLLDATAALSYLQSRTDIKKEHLIIYGQSLGGHLAINLAARNQDMIDGLVTEGAFSSHKDIAAETAGFIGRIIVAEKYSGLESVRNFHKPVLIIHSTEDETIPFEQGEKLFANANEPKTFLKIDKCHICGLSFYPDEILNAINKLLLQVN